MRKLSWYVLLALALLSSPSPLVSQTSKETAKVPSKKNELRPKFQTSDRCLACHNGLTAPSGKDVSIGFDWRSTILARSGWHTYWPATLGPEAFHTTECPR